MSDHFKNAGLFDLSGRRAIVTGGGGGIGAGLATGLHDAGAEVLIIGRSDTTTQAAGKIGSTDRPVLARRIDLTDRQALSGGFEEAVAALGGLKAPAYAAAKGAIVQLTKALANEWSPHDVNVNAIAPGYIRPQLNVHIWQDPVRSEATLARIPSGRWGEPQDLQGTAIFLASSASNYLHGVTIAVDGGFLAR